MSFFEKLGLGLKKSSEKITSGLNDIFNKKVLDADIKQDLEDTLLEADMGVRATEEILKDFTKQKIDKNADIQQIKKLLAQSVSRILKLCEQKLIIPNDIKPFVILMIGVNGGGKTTTIGKLAAKMQSQGKKVSLIAADTFRAAATEQLKAWAQKCNIRIFCGDSGCDSAGLCYDGIKEAIKEQDDVVFIDTAGRLQNKSGLMDELKKITRVIKKILPQAPHCTILTLDATNGQNTLSQVDTFKNTIGVNGLIVTKLDGTAKGGILVAICKEYTLPVYFIGVGEQIDDLDIFNAEEFSNKLLNVE